MAGPRHRGNQDWDARWLEITGLFEKCIQLAPDDCESLLGSLGKTHADLVVAVRELIRKHNSTDDSFLGRPPMWNIESLDLQEALESSAPPTADTPSTSADPRATRRWRIAFAFANSLVLAAFCFVALLAGKYGSHSVETGWDASPTRSGWVVSDVTPGGPADGTLQLGDRIVAVGEQSTDVVTLPAALAGVAAGHRYTLRILRTGTAIRVELASAISDDKRTPRKLATAIGVSIPFIIAGVLLSILKPQARGARLGYAALILTGMAVLRVAASVYSGFLQGTVLTLYAVLFLCDGVHLAAAYHFYCAFFRELHSSPRLNITVPLVYAWGGAVSLSRLVTSGAVSLPLFATNTQWISIIHTIAWPLYLFVPLASWAVIGYHYPRISDTDARRRARGIVLGTVAGLAPHITYRILLFAVERGWSPLTSEAQYLVQRISLVSTDLIPFCTAYAVLRHQTFDIAIVIRRGLQYRLFKRVLQVLLLLPSLTLLVSIFTHSERSVADALWRNAWTLTLMLCIGCILLVRKPLASRLERHFHREPYDGEKILLTLVEKLGNVSCMEEAAQSVGKEIESALHPSRIMVLLANRNGPYMAIVHDSTPEATQPRLPVHSAFVYALQATRTGTEIATLRQRLETTAGADSVAAAGLEFAIPVLSKAGNIAAILLLGRKLSEEPYTEQDCNFLIGIARHFAIAQENLSRSSRIQEPPGSSTSVEAHAAESPIGMSQCPQCKLCFEISEKTCSIDGAVLEVSQFPRTIKHYRLDRFVGKGAAGSVYRALDGKLDRPVAIKIIPAEKIPTETAIKRVKREARAAARLIHPNIVTVHEIDELHTGDMFIVMEYADGDTLRAILGQRRAGRRDFALWFDQLFDVLHAAHSNGIVHRDLKPENLLIARLSGGRTALKILDFGVARLAQSDETVEPAAGHDDGPVALTRDGTLIGSLNYMAPEQIRCEPADERSDIYAAGLILYECLIGSFPFADMRHHERLALGEQTLPFPAGSESERPLYRAMQKCLALKPADRFRSAAEARAAIIPLLQAASLLPDKAIS